MHKRYMLRRHIVSAWHKTIEAAYSERLVNSERSLQHYFCANLIAEFAEAKVSRSLFVEPCFSCPTTGQRRSPDIIVCHTKQIIAAIELKFLPRGRPATAKDLDTLEWLASIGGAVSLSNDRYLGKPLVNKQYTIADDAILCWGGVYKAPEMPLEAGSHMSKRFLALHAITKHGEEPQVLPAAAAIPKISIDTDPQQQEAALP